MWTIQVRPPVGPMHARALEKGCNSRRFFYVVHTEGAVESYSGLAVQRVNLRMIFCNFPFEYLIVVFTKHLRNLILPADLKDRNFMKMVISGCPLKLSEMTVMLSIVVVKVFRHTWYCVFCEGIVSLTAGNFGKKKAKRVVKCVDCLGAVTTFWHVCWDACYLGTVHFKQITKIFLVD